MCHSPKQQNSDHDISKAIDADNTSPLVMEQTENINDNYFDGEPNAFEVSDRNAINDDRPSEEDKLSMSSQNIDTENHWLHQVEIPSFEVPSLEVEEKRPEDLPPSNYICRKCGQVGKHWIMHCKMGMETTEDMNDESDIEDEEENNDIELI
eukprot:UN05350